MFQSQDVADSLLPAKGQVVGIGYLQKQAEMVVAGPPIAVNIHDEPPPVAVVVDRRFGILRLLAPRLPFLGIVGDNVRELARRLLALWLPNDRWVAILIRRYRMVRPWIVIRDESCRWRLRRLFRRACVNATFAITTAAAATSATIRRQGVRSITGKRSSAAAAAATHAGGRCRRSPASGTTATLALAASVATSVSRCIVGRR
mmetsp:Transcript_26518/g.76554  ORF Transcript_26518/g.76554 Transcript_26518/m.76554 type:complete len:203 (-) Transcript_26518:359-967(-)